MIGYTQPSIPEWSQQRPKEFYDNTTNVVADLKNNPKCYVIAQIMTSSVFDVSIVIYNNN